MDRFDKDHGDERRDTPIVQEWVAKILGLYDIEEADITSQKAGIDFFAKANGGIKYSFEDKIRYTYYDDVLIETISNMNTLSKGWIHYSKADFLSYPFIIDGTIKKGYIFDLPKLQAWWKAHGRNIKYPIKYGKTSNLYKTQNVAVPEKDIPLDCVVYHPQYGRLRGIGEELDSSYFR